MHDRAPHPLLSAERRQAILDALARDGKVVAARLVEELGVSEDTVRRDLRELAAQGLVQRVHGGALAPAPQQGSFSHRRETWTDAKPALAQAAVAVLAGARVILLDGSTTNLELACRLPHDHACTVLTNSPPIASALADHPVGRGRGHRRPARQARAGDGRRRRRRVPAQRARRRLRARRLRAASRGRAVDRRPRGGARQAGDGGGLGRRDRARDRGQAAGGQRLPRRAGLRAHPRGGRGRRRRTRCSIPTARSA